MESYRTLMGPGESLIIEKKSKFLGHCLPVDSQQLAIDFIARMKSEYRDASHNVGAYYIRNGNINHSSDDGEPSGTAGMPVLDVLQKGKIVDAVIVVTRYFGGTLLGTGGLVRAYSAAASAAVKAAGVAVMTLCYAYDIPVEYSLYESLLKLLLEIGARVETSDFSERVMVRCTIKKEMEPRLLEMVRELSRGASVPERTREFFDPFERLDENEE